MLNQIKADDFPVDFVMPYVDSLDYNWQISYKKVSERMGRPVNLNSQRFRSWDNLYFIFRGIEKFMPWIRKVHLIVCAPSQVPEWLNQETVDVVYHRDIIPRRYRPVFNSCTIEMFLRNIPDLAEHFIYSNDDVYITDTCEPEDFFTHGYPNLHYRKAYYSDSQNMFRHQCRNGLELVSGDFNVHCDGFIYKNSHSVAPMLKSTLDKVWELHSEAMEDSITRFRTSRNVNQYVYSYYQYFSNMFVDKTFPNMYTCFSDYSLRQICTIIDKQITSLLCINDAGHDIRFNFYKEMLRRAFCRILPNKSKYEI